MRRELLVCSLLASMAFASASAAGPYDVILADGADVTLCSNGCGITLAGLDYGLLVNTGTADITIADLQAAHFSVAASRPEIVLIPFLNIPNEQAVGVIHPGEAMGSVIPGNELLLPLIRAGETLRNLAGMQFMAYQIERPGTGFYEGPADFDVIMTLVGYTARFTIHTQVHLGDFAISFTHATRVSASPGGGVVLDCSRATATPSVVWPPNHQLVPITIAGAVDASGNPLAIMATSVMQDEPPAGFPDTTVADAVMDDGGDDMVLAGSDRSGRGGPTGVRTCPDAIIQNGEALVRAERLTGGNGRVYIIAFTGRDSGGFECTGSVTVCVPRNRSDDACVDDGPRFDSLDRCSSPPRGRGRMPDHVRLVAPAVARGVVVFSYSLQEATDLDLELFDVAGRRMATLEHGLRSAGDHSVSWSPGGVPRGVYFVRARTGQQVVTRQVVLSSN